MDILQYKGKFTLKDREWNKMSVDKIRELRQVALMAFKSQDKVTEMPGEDTSEDAFTEWTANLHSTLKTILCEVCSDTYTMFKIQHPDHSNGVRDFKRKWWHDKENKREEDAKAKAAAKHDNDDQELPAMKAKKANPKTEKKETKKQKEKKGD